MSGRGLLERGVLKDLFVVGWGESSLRGGSPSLIVRCRVRLFTDFLRVTMILFRGFSAACN